jgi:hypothetical protein
MWSRPPNNLRWHNISYHLMTSERNLAVTRTKGIIIAPDADKSANVVRIQPTNNLKCSDSGIALPIMSLKSVVVVNGPTILIDYSNIQAKPTNPSHSVCLKMILINIIFSMCIRKLRLSTKDISNDILSDSVLASIEKIVQRTKNRIFSLPSSAHHFYNDKFRLRSTNCEA